MKTYDWFTYSFEDGYCMMVRGMSKTELKREESRHGKCLGKTYAGRW